MLPSTLGSDTASLSLAAGGTLNFCLNAGPSFATRPYVLLGSLSGTTPGFSFGGLTLPLNVDAYLRTTFRRANQPSYAGFRGLLDSNGQASAQFILGPNPNASWMVNMEVHYAFGAVGVRTSFGTDIAPVSTVFVSDAVSVSLTP